MRWTWMVVLAWVAGCNGIELIQQHAPLTRSVPVPPGAECSHGGRSLQAGLDRDEDGVLDDLEVTSTERVCFTALTRRQPEPSGGHCERGGQVVRMGVDANADGELQEEEVSATEYLCASSFPNVLVRSQAVPPGGPCPLGGHLSRAGHDANGNGELEDGEVTREVYGCKEPERVVSRVRAFEQDGLCPSGGTLVEVGLDLDGDNALDDTEVLARSELCEDTSRVRLRHAPEPAGEACPAGGMRVGAGADTDGDGLLDEEESTQTLLVCQPLRTHHGDYVVRGAADLAALQGISRIRGSLQLLGLDLPQVVLPALAVVEGELLIHRNEHLRRVEMTGLRLVGHDLTVEFNDDLEALVLGGGGGERLLVGLSLSVSYNGRLPSLSGLSLVRPHGSLTLRGNGTLEHGPAEAGFLLVETLAGDLTVYGNGAMETLPFPNLQHVSGGLRLWSNASLRSLSGLGRLETIGGDADIMDNDAMLSLEGADRLRTVTGGVSLTANDGLRTTAGLTALTAVGALVLRGNGVLETVGDMPLLESTGSRLEVSDHPRLRSVRNLGGLRSLRELQLENNAQLTGVPGLMGVKQVDLLMVRRNAALASLADFVRLDTVAMLRVQDNPALARLDLGALQEVAQEFIVTSNPGLPTCQAAALAAEVFTGPPEGLRLEGNDGTATCGNRGLPP